MRRRGGENRGENGGERVGDKRRKRRGEKRVSSLNVRYFGELFNVSSVPTTHSACSKLCNNRSPNHLHAWCYYIMLVL